MRRRRQFRQLTRIGAVVTGPSPPKPQGRKNAPVIPDTLGGRPSESGDAASTGSRHPWRCVNTRDVHDVRAFRRSQQPLPPRPAIGFRGLRNCASKTSGLSGLCGYSHCTGSPMHWSPLPLRLVRKNGCRSNDRQPFFFSGIGAAAYCTAGSRGGCAASMSALVAVAVRGAAARQAGVIAGTAAGIGSGHPTSGDGLFSPPCRSGPAELPLAGHAAGAGFRTETDARREA